MDTLKCCGLCAVMWNIELTCRFQGKVTKIPLKREKEKYHSDLLVFTPLKTNKQKRNLGNEHLKNEGVNLIEV